MTERRTGRVAGAKVPGLLGLGLLLGMVGGWVAGLMRVPHAPEPGPPEPGR